MNDDTGGLHCFGEATHGQLGYQNTATVGASGDPGSMPPAKVNIGAAVLAVAAAGSQTCVLTVQSTVRCWGLGKDGRLGYGSLATLGSTPGSMPPRM